MRDDKNKISVKDMTEWAEGTLAEWLPGYTDSTLNNSQYKIVHLDEDRFRVESTYGAPDQGEARVFVVMVKVREVL